ncbi:MAG: hypothetical protein WKG06_43555 [Segetibacter sp.]
MEEAWRQVAEPAAPGLYAYARKKGAEAEVARQKCNLNVQMNYVSKKVVKKLSRILAPMG